MMWKHAKAPQGTVGDYRQQLVRNLATMMISSRFDDMAEKASAPFLSAGGGYGGFIGKHTDAFMLSAQPKDNRIEEATAMLLKEMKRVDEHGFVQTELDRAKESMLESYRKSAKELNKTQSNSFAQEYTNNFLNGEVIPGIRQRKKATMFPLKMRFSRLSTTTRMLPQNLGLTTIRKRNSSPKRSRNALLSS